MAARTLLLKLERAGQIRLPPRRRESNNRFRIRNVPLVAHATAPIRGPLRELRHFAVSVVEPGSEDLRLFNCLLSCYHYLGYRNTVGENSERPWAERHWIYDLRTNKRFTLKTRTLHFEDLLDFIQCYNPQNRFERQEAERCKSFTYDELMQRDKVSLDITWLRDDSLEDSANLPLSEELAREIAEDLEAALEQFRAILEGLEER